MDFKFLNQVNSIVKIYEKRAELTGENFNVFSIMNMESDEVKTHSAIIGELLSTNGSHGLGNEPLNLFIKVICYKIKNDFFDIEKAICRKEFYAGKVDSENDFGGRIDLIVVDQNKNGFVIENKIYADEQKRQLHRYNSAFPKAKILFLTLFGDESKGEDKTEYTSISYEKDILKWIELCSQIAYNKPIIRETLNQYAHLIKKLTNQTTNKEMREEILKIMNENFEASSEIYKNFENVLKKRQDEFLENLGIKLSKESGKWDIISGKFKNVKSLEIKKDNLIIRYRIKSLKHSAFGIVGLDSLNKELIQEGFSENKNSNNTYWHLAHNELNTMTLSNPEEKINEIAEKLRRIINIINPKKFLYIHGLNSDANSRKYVNLKDYFKDKFDFSCLEWRNEDNISELLDEAERTLKGEINPVIFGDSTGANFAYQLRERRKSKGQSSVLIVSSPLLDISKRIADFDFPENLKSYLQKIKNPKDLMIIAPENDELIDHSFLQENQLENVILFKVNDSHRLPNFKNYLTDIENYIKPI